MNRIQLEDKICWNKFLYYVKAEPTMSDYEYDMLERKLKELFPDSLVLTEYIECPREMWEEYEAQYRFGRRI